MSTERKTELGRDLQRRADDCQAIAAIMTRDDRIRCEAKAQAYAHAAELADAAAEGSK